MIVIDPGHRYVLDQLDGYNNAFKENLTFVKRFGKGYPGNKSTYPGTNIQEVLRCLIDRLKYLNKQVPYKGNIKCIENLRNTLKLLEIRAAKRHKRKIPKFRIEIEKMRYCKICGHIGCKGTHETKPNNQ